MTKQNEKSKPAEETISAVKGFDQSLRCRDYQFEVGHTYEHDGPVKACESGFHACEYPLDVFGYYPPVTSRYADVTQSGAISRHDGDSKVASAKITINAELHIHDLVQRAVKWIFDRSKPEGNPATGDRGAAMASGYLGRAMASEGSAIFLLRRAANGTITHIWAGIAGQGVIKPLTFYTLDDDGQPIEWAE